VRNGPPIELAFVVLVIVFCLASQKAQHQREQRAREVQTLNTLSNLLFIATNSPGTNIAGTNVMLKISQ
jgi:hypothetical protein